MCVKQGNEGSVYFNLEQYKYIFFNEQDKREESFTILETLVYSRNATKDPVVEVVQEDIIFGHQEHYDIHGDDIPSNKGKISK